ncbi:MAG: hypothetical protein ACREQJ_18545, partial [Candidatus Binatia bacterium]
ERARAARSDARTKRATRVGDVLRRVVALARFVPNSPSATKDTLELRLDCGHRHAWLRRSAESFSGFSGADALQLLGTEVPCARCSTTRRLQRNDDSLGARRRLEKLLQPRV